MYAHQEVANNKKEQAEENITATNGDPPS